MVSISYIINFHLFIEHINKNDQQSSTFSKFSRHVWKGGYQPLGGGSVEKKDNELEDKVSLIWNGWKSGTEEMRTSGPYPTWNRKQ